MSKAQLREYAYDRWGDAWFLETHEHADGDEHHKVVHTETLVADGIVIRDIAELDGDDVSVTRHLVDTNEYLAQIDTDGT